MMKMEHHKTQDISQIEQASNRDSREHNGHLKVKEHRNADGVLEGFQADLDSLPKGYYTSSFFLGTMFATGLGLAAGVGGFALAAPNLALINADIGPSPSYIWISLSYTLTLAIGLLMVGRLSDLFGRRWFFISGQILSLIGCVVAATAKTIPTLIGAIVLVGLAASTQLSFPIVSNELVPMKYRFMCNAWLYIWTLPISAFGPVVSKAFILETKASWRGGFYLMIGVNALAATLYFFFYHPPTFHMKFANRTLEYQLKHFDYFGAFLFVSGLTLFLLGLSSGGTVYPWKSATIVCFLVIGFVLLIIFGLWEGFAPLQEPLVPKHLFKKFTWVACMINLGLGASVYYAMAIIWPQMVAVLFTTDGGASLHAAWLSSLPGVLIVTGQLSAGALAVVIGKTRYQVIIVLTVGGALLASIASCGPSDLNRAAALMALGCFFVGWNESVCLANAGIEIDDQQEIGTAIGMAGSVRSAISGIASAVYVAVLTNRLTTTIPAEVPPAVIAAGLPKTSVVAFLTGFSTGNFTAVDGLTPQILGVGVTAYKEASAQAYKTVFLTTLAFSGVAIILSLFNPNVDDKMTNEVATTLHQGNDEHIVAEKGS